MAAPPIVITGPGGWIGSAFLAGLAARDGPDWIEKVRLFGSCARTLTAPDGGSLTVRPLDEISPAHIDGAQIIHLAYLTKEKADALGEAAFVAQNEAIDAALETALRGARPAGLFVASSGAAALAEDGRDDHPYGRCKLAQERRFLRYGVETGVPVTVGRVWNLAGPFINKLDSYAISSFLVQARRSGTIAIDARVPVYRAYLHVMDLVALVLAAFDRGLAATRPIDFAGALVVEMEDIARAAARATGLGHDKILRGPVDFERPSVYLGSAVDTRTLALRCGIALAGFERQVFDTLAFVDQQLGASWNRHEAGGFAALQPIR